MPGGQKSSQHRRAATIGVCFFFLLRPKRKRNRPDQLTDQLCIFHSFFCWNSEMNCDVEMHTHTQNCCNYSNFLFVLHQETCRVCTKWNSECEGKKKASEHAAERKERKIITNSFCRATIFRFYSFSFLERNAFFFFLFLYSLILCWHFLFRHQPSFHLCWLREWVVRTLLRFTRSKIKCIARARPANKQWKKKNRLWLRLLLGTFGGCRFGSLFFSHSW